MRCFLRQQDNGSFFTTDSTDVADFIHDNLYNPYNPWPFYFDKGNRDALLPSSAR
jgi:hypothetical protein